MAKYAQTLAVYCPSSSSWKYVPFYSTTTEAGAYGAYGVAIVSNNECYYPLGPAGNAFQTDLVVVK